MAMFLKVLGAGGNEFLDQAGDPKPGYSIYSDVVSCHFRRYKAREQGTGDAPWGEAHIWVREPVKTADVPGFCEVEKFVQLTGDAFLMNEQGRTISKFTAPGCVTVSSASGMGFAGGMLQSAGRTVDRSLGAGVAISGAPREQTDEERTAELLKQLPYWSAVQIRGALEQWRAVGGSTVGGPLLEIMDRERIAVG